MENASKALIMAATILIGVTILSLGVYLFAYFANYAKEVEDENRTNQIAQFNSQFLSYQNKEMTFYDVITLSNLARNYNISNDFSKDYFAYINVNISGNNLHFINFEENVKNLNISEHPNYVYSDPDKGILRNYKATFTLNDTTQYVKTINITDL